MPVRYSTGQRVALCALPALVGKVVVHHEPAIVWVAFDALSSGREQNVIKLDPLLVEPLDFPRPRGAAEARAVARGLDPFDGAPPTLDLKRAP